MDDWADLLKRINQQTNTKIQNFQNKFSNEKQWLKKYVFDLASQFSIATSVFDEVNESTPSSHKNLKTIQSKEQIKLTNTSASSPIAPSATTSSKGILASIASLSNIANLVASTTSFIPSLRSRFTSNTSSSTSSSLSSSTTDLSAQNTPQTQNSFEDISNSNDKESDVNQLHNIPSLSSLSFNDLHKDKSKSQWQKYQEQHQNSDLSQLHPDPLSLSHKNHTRKRSKSEVSEPTMITKKKRNETIEEITKTQNPLLNKKQQQNLKLQMVKEKRRQLEIEEKKKIEEKIKINKEKEERRKKQLEIEDEIRQNKIKLEEEKRKKAFLNKNLKIKQNLKNKTLNLPQTNNPVPPLPLSTHQPSIEDSSSQSFDTSISTVTSNKSSHDVTFIPPLPHPPSSSTAEGYHLNDFEKISHDDDEEDDRTIPNWAQFHNLYASLRKQRNIDVDQYFQPLHQQNQSCNLSEIFEDFSPQPYYSHRSSSGNWNQDRLQFIEELEYKKTLGI